MSNIINSINEYLNIIQSARSTNTYKTYAQALKRFVEIVGEDAPINRDTYILFLKRTASMNPATRDIHRTAIMGLYLFCAEDDSSINIPALIQANKRYVKKTGKRLPIYDRDGIEKVLTHCNTIRNGLLDLRDRAFVLTLADTGLRIGEACALQRGTIDWQEGRAVIIGKGDKQAVIHFSNRALAALREYLAARAELDGSTGKPLASLPLFARHDRGAGNKIKSVHPGGMWAAIKERIQEAGVNPENIRIHDFRHYFVSMILASTDNLRIAQELARHEDIKTTARYAHLGGETEKIYDDIFNH